MSASEDVSGDDLIVVTGGAGFIGSHIARDLAEAGWRVVIADVFGSGDKWRNLAGVQLHDIVRPDAMFEWLGRHAARVSAIVHMAAISSTTETDVDRFVTNNIRLTLDLWGWSASNGARLIYASSAATYGDGSAGFSDDQSPTALASLRPLNAYGWSKHVVDRRVAEDVVAAGTAYGMSVLTIARLAAKGTPLPVLGHGYYLTMAAGLLVSLTMITAALPLLGRMTTPASVRFE